MVLEILAIVVILILGIAPMILSVWGMHSLARHPRLYLHRRRAVETERSPERHLYWASWLDPSHYVGDTSCQFNAHSPFLRCAVNPAGPCQGCPCYEPSAHLTQR